MSRISRRLTLDRTLIATVLLVAAISTVACGGSPSTGSPAAPASSSAPSGGPQGGGFQGNREQFTKIISCLRAAGLEVPDLPSGIPSGMPSGSPPSGFPGGGVPSDGVPPSGAPTSRPSGRGFGGIDFTDPKVQAALKVCGITVPSGQPTALPST